MKEISYEDLPEMCYTYVISKNEIGVIKKGEKGYHRSHINDLEFDEDVSLKEIVKDRNEVLGVSENERIQMEMMSMFGWNNKEEQSIEEVEIEEAVKVEEDLSNEDKFKIVNIDKIITKLQTQFDVDVIGSYTDNSIILEIKGNILKLIDAYDCLVDYLKPLDDVCTYEFSDKTDDNIITCTITER